MGQLHVEGPTSAEFLQSMLSNDLDRLADGEAQYTLLTNERGGIVDDLIVYRMSRPLPARRQRRQQRGCVHLAQGTGGARDGGARRVRRVRARRRAGAALARAARPRRGAGVHARDGRDRRHRGDGLPHRLHGRAGRRAPLRRRRRRRALGRGARAGGRPGRARRAGHAAPRGLLPAPRQRHHAGHGRDLGRARLDVRARHGVHGRRRPPSRQGGRAGAQARRVRDGGEGDPAPRHGRSRAGARSPPARSRRRSTWASAWGTSRPRTRRRTRSS